MSQQCRSHSVSLPYRHRQATFASFFIQVHDNGKVKTHNNNACVCLNREFALSSGASPIGSFEISRAGHGPTTPSARSTFFLRARVRIYTSFSVSPRHSGGSSLDASRKIACVSPPPLLYLQDLLSRIVSTIHYCTPPGDRNFFPLSSEGHCVIETSFSSLRI